MSINYVNFDEVKLASMQLAIAETNCVLAKALLKLATPDDHHVKKIIDTWFCKDWSKNTIDTFKTRLQTIANIFTDWENVTITNYDTDDGTMNAACCAPQFFTSTGEWTNKWVFVCAVAAKGGSETIELFGMTIDPLQGKIDIEVYPPFYKLPIRGAWNTGSDAQQDQIETLIHEMSHAIAATQDRETKNGDIAYGRDGALELVTEGNWEYARTNAENWGMLAEELGQD